jgi:hypothetical protein
MYGKSKEWQICIQSASDQKTKKGKVIDVTKIIVKSVLRKYEI